MIEEFNKYINNFDMNIIEIKRKYNHSLRVMNLAKKYAKILNFSNKDIELASVIGLLHDIGRFEQFTKYHTFDDNKSIDHANYGVEILFKNNLIKRIYPNGSEEDYKIIAFAIRNHNKLAIEKNNNNEKYMQHAKLVRDVDKIDLIFLAGKLKETNYKATNESVNSQVLDCIYKHKSVDKKNIKNMNDRIALRFSFAFDINYDICLNELKYNLIYFYQAIADKENKIKNIYEETIKYIDNRLNK